MAPGTRRVLQVVGPLVMVAGLVTIVVAFVGLGDDSGPEMGEEGWFEAKRDAGLQTFLTFALGGFLLFVGGVVSSFGFRKPMSELAATDTEVAVEHSSAALGRGLVRGGIGGGHQQIVRIKCRSCGHLETEDATYCSKCGKTV